MGDSTPPHPLDQTSSSQLKRIMQKGTLNNAHGRYIVVLSTQVRGCRFDVECGISASGHRRSLRVKTRGEENGLTNEPTSAII